MESGFDLDDIRKICESKIKEVITENASLSSLNIIYSKETIQFTTLKSHVKLELIPSTPKVAGLGPSALLRHNIGFVINSLVKNNDNATGDLCTLLINKFTKKVLRKSINSAIFSSVYNMSTPIDKDWTRKTSVFSIMYDEYPSV